MDNFQYNILLEKLNFKIQLDVERNNMLMTQNKLLKKMLEEEEKEDTNEKNYTGETEETNYTK